MQDVFLGVDGGGSKTAALIVSIDGTVLGQGRGGASNYQVSSIETAMNNVQTAIREAQSQIEGEINIISACYCMAGADMPYDFSLLTTALKSLNICDNFYLYNDVIGIFRAGSRFPYGVGVVCGTGFNAGGIDKNDQEVRFPALGTVTGDRAGGSHIGLMALSEAFRAWDGRGEATQLEQAILQEFQVDSFDTLASWVVEGKLSHDMIRGLAPLVFTIANQGDAVAGKIIRDAGLELGIAARAILRRLQLTDEDCDVVLGGSVVHGEGNILFDAVCEIVHPVAPKVTVKRLDVPPVVGAVLMAVDHSSFTATEAFQARIRASLIPT